MKNIVEELWHNLKSGVFVNLILIVLFTLFFWQGTAISSYFVDIPIGSSGSRQADGLYYQLSYYYMSDNSRTGSTGSSTRNWEKNILTSIMQT